jgi:uncharacterized protein YndB with AHSA1/START domain
MHGTLHCKHGVAHKQRKIPQQEKPIMAAKKTVKKSVKKAVKKTAKTAAKKVVKKTVAPKVEKPKALPVGKGPIKYTTSNTFKASVATVWAAATEKKHLVKYFLDDMRGSFDKPGTVEWFWKEWGWMPVEVVKYVKNKELVMLTSMGGTYKTTVRYEILRKKGVTIFRVHESGYATKDLTGAFMMCEGWSEFHCYLKAHLMGVDLRKAG